MKNEKAKIIMVPYPAKGHVTPMLKLACSLASRGFEPVLVIPEFIHRSVSTQTEALAEISWVSIPADRSDESSPRDFFAIEMAMENNMPFHLEKIVEKLEDEDSGRRIACLVVDLLASWAVEVGSRREIPVAGFWPAMLETYHLIAAIPDMIRTGIISDTGIPLYQGPMFFKTVEPRVSAEDLPWLIGTLAERKSRFKFWTRALDRSRSLQWLLVNSFSDNYCDENNPQPPEISLNYPQILPTGPLFIGSGMKNDSFWKEDVSCLKWLEKQVDGCVLYISFGSWVRPIGEAKVKGLAVALEALARPFIWVLGSNWRDGLPIGFEDRVSGMGRVVSWAPQMEVLQHKAVGCYLTHCGWNSTVEAIQCRKPMLCFPVAGDQFLNCRYIAKVWRVGVRLSGLGYRDLEDGMKRVMGDDKMRERLIRVNDRIMGKEASLKKMANIATFTDSISQNKRS